MALPNDAAEEAQPFINEKPEAKNGNRHHALLQSHRRLRRWTVTSNIVLGLVVVVLAIKIAIGVSPEQALSSPVPHMPATRVVFQQNELFAGELSPENDAAWGSLMPPGDGFVVVDNPKSYNLPPGKDTKHGEVYDVSVFHQLHCLANIRQYLYLMKDSISSNNTQRIQDLVLAPESHHVHHCFDYIRQGIMCGADTTLEWPREGPDGERSAFDGWGVEHQCKDWESIMEWMGENSNIARLWDEPVLS